MTRSAQALTPPATPATTRPTSPAATGPKRDDPPAPAIFATRDLPGIMAISPFAVGIGFATALSIAVTLAGMCKPSGDNDGHAPLACEFYGKDTAQVLRSISYYIKATFWFAISLLWYIVLQIVIRWPPIAYRIEDQEEWGDDVRIDAEKRYKFVRILIILGFDFNLTTILLGMGYMGRGLELLDESFGRGIVFTLVSLVCGVVAILSALLLGHQVQGGRTSSTL